MNESSFLGQIQTQMAQLSAQQLLRQRRVTQPLHGTNMRVDGQDMLTFCSNDYLGLATHPDLVRAAQHAATLYGVGSGGSPMVTGHSQANAQLELALAQWLQLPKALYFYAGFAANVGIIPALVGQGDAIFSDELNHACLIDGARLSKACIHRYAHLNLQDLSTALSQSQARRKLVITDAVFSMDGNSAPIANLLALCEQHDAVLLLDDAHGLGVLGSQGRGSLAQAGLCGEGASPRVLYMATLGKAAGVAGAFVAGSELLVDWLLQATRSYMFATAAPAMLASAVQASIQVMSQADDLRGMLKARIDQFKQGIHPILGSGPWRLLPSDTAIQSLVIGRNADALQAMQQLWQQGIWVAAIRPPTVPSGTARLRITLSAAHTEQDVARLLVALKGTYQYLSLKQQ